MHRELIMAVAALLSTTTLGAAQVAAAPAQQPLPPSFVQLGLVIYPAQGQTPEQQALDEAACWDWAEAQTAPSLQWRVQRSRNRLTISVHSSAVPPRAAQAAASLSEAAVQRSPQGGRSGGSGRLQDRMQFSSTLFEISLQRSSG